MIQLSSITSLLPNVYSFGNKLGQTLVKYYMLLLINTKQNVLLPVMDDATTSSATSSSSSSSSSHCSSNIVFEEGSDSICNTNPINEINNSNNNMNVMMIQQLPQYIYQLIVSFPVWYSEWWWNLVQNDPIHVFVETLLLCAIVYFLVSRRGGKSYKDTQKNNTSDKLTKVEEDELIQQWILHERQPLTPRNTSSTTSNGIMNGTSTSPNSNTTEDYRRTLVVHRSNGRFMEVEEIQHSSSVPASTSSNTTTTTTMKENGTTTSLASISELATDTTLPSTTSTTNSATATTPTIIKVLNFATMDFLGMSADSIPNVNDDDEDDDDVTVGINPIKNSKRSTTTTTTNNNTNNVLKKEQPPLHPVKVASLEALDRYGCGSCGPRGFYGTIDVHIQLEQDIASFLQTDTSILYSDGASTVSSTIAAFCKRGDVIVVDEAVYEPIRTGIYLSRANVKWFAHNDMNDLRRVLVSIQTADKKIGRKPNAQRRFIVVEGLYKNTGTICPMDELIALKHEFSYRLIVDESFSFGVLGPTGRGVTELYQHKLMHDVEITCVSLENAIGSIGGLTTGTEEVVEHQRLSGSGYCFSASSPPFTASAAIAALQLLQTRPDITLHRLNRNITYIHTQLQSLLHDKLDDLLYITSDVRSPIIMLQVADIPETEYLDEVVFLQEVVRESFIRGIAFVATATGTSAIDTFTPIAAATTTSSNTTSKNTTTTKLSPTSVVTTTSVANNFISDPPPGIRITVSALHTYKDIDLAVHVLNESVDVVMSRFYDEETTM